MDMTVKPDKDKVQKNVAWGNIFWVWKNHTVRELSQLFGTLVSCFPAVEYTQLYYFVLERDKSQALKENYGHFDVLMNVSDPAREEIR